LPPLPFPPAGHTLFSHKHIPHPLIPPSLPCSYVVINRLPTSLHLRAEILPLHTDAPADAPPHVELAPGSATDLYCFEPLPDVTLGRDSGGGGDGGGGAGGGAGGGRGGGGASTTAGSDGVGAAAPPAGASGLRVLRFRLPLPGGAWGAAVHVDTLDDTFFTLDDSSDRSGSRASTPTPGGGGHTQASGRAGSRRSGESPSTRHGGAPATSAHGRRPQAQGSDGAGSASGACARGCPPLLRASVVVRGCTVFIALIDASDSPPYCIENHSLRASVVVRQSGPSSYSREELVGPCAWLALAPQPRRGGVAPAASSPFTLLVRPAAPAAPRRAFGPRPIDGWRDFPLRDIRVLSPLALPSGRRLHVSIRQKGPTRVLVLSDEPLQPATRRRLIAGLVPRARLQLRANLAAISISLMEVSPAGAARELLNGSLRGVALTLIPTPDHTDAHLVVQLLQLDNMLPHARHGVLLRAGALPSPAPAPPRHPGRAAAGAAPPSHGERRGTGRPWSPPPPRALSLRAVRRGDEFELFSVDLAPLLLALEATVFARLSLLLPPSRAALARLGPPAGSGGALSAGGGGQGDAPDAKALLQRRLSAALDEPPEFSKRRPIYFDLLRIGQVDVTVSSALEVQREEAPRQPAAGRGVGALGVGGGGGGGGIDWVTAVGSVPVFSHLLQSMLVLAKGIGLNFGSVTGVPLSFAPVRMERALFTPQALMYRLAQQASWQAAAQVSWGGRGRLQRGAKKGQDRRAGALWGGAKKGRGRLGANVGKLPSPGWRVEGRWLHTGSTTGRVRYPHSFLRPSFAHIHTHVACLLPSSHQPHSTLTPPHPPPQTLTPTQPLNPSTPPNLTPPAAPPRRPPFVTRLARRSVILTCWATLSAQSPP
jgi:hypothetical protein